MTKVVGLCGGSGSGKSMVCEIFKEFGIDNINTDKIYHELTSQKSDCLDDLVNHFGTDILTDGILDRAKLREIVFSSDEKLKELNKITHPHILKKVREKIEEHKRNGSKGVIVDAPALIESGFDKECDFRLCVYADIETRIQRIIKRDGITREQAEKRIYSQIATDYLLEICDYSIENNGSVAEVRINTLAAKKYLFDYKYNISPAYKGFEKYR